MRTGPCAPLLVMVCSWSQQRADSPRWPEAVGHIVTQRPFRRYRTVSVLVVGETRIFVGERRTFAARSVFGTFGDFFALLKLESLRGRLANHIGLFMRRPTKESVPLI